ncbi:PHB depolymerase family esterase [soil metagenome]
MRSLAFALACSFAVMFAGCSTAETTPPGPSPEGHVFGGSRPVLNVRAPDKYDRQKPVSLVLMLHGYGSDALQTNLLFGLQYIADDENLLLAIPEGTTDTSGKKFWNATEACCDFGNTGVDDVKYLLDLVKELRTYYAVDPKRIYVVGVSNGGFMALRLGCEAADVFAAIVSYAGAGYSDATKCTPTAPIGVLQLHGTADTTVPYQGGTLGVGSAVVPSAMKTTSDWAARNGCGASPDMSAPAIDFDLDQPGAETKITSWTGCTANGGTRLFTIEGSPHVSLGVAKALPGYAWGFLKDHAKP